MKKGQTKQLWFFYILKNEKCSSIHKLFKKLLSSEPVFNYQLLVVTRFPLYLGSSLIGLY